MAGMRRRIVLETLILAVLIALVAINAMWRMDYLGASTAYQIRMTDASRTALVGKNIVDGLGYKTNDLPATLVDFYDQRGKLRDEAWVNADRFPFAAYATAALMVICRSTSYEVGILLYNILCFVGFLVVLYRLTQVVWHERWSALLAVGLALLHPYTFVYLYLKDADMLLLVAVALLLLYRYLARPEATSKPLALGIGTILAWLFLSRPNLGAPFIVYYAVVAVRRWWLVGRDAGWGQALRDLMPREGLALIVGGLWCLPFVIHSFREWGSPLFSANNLYQLPLGTRFAMGTDTWWKYTEPGHPITLATILSEAPRELATKFTSSWVATVRSCFMAYAIEIGLAISLLAIRARRSAGTAPPAPPAPRDPLNRLVALVGFALVANLLLLPLYGYQNYAYRHYIGFIFPLMWLLAGRALYLLAEQLRPIGERVMRELRERGGRYLALGLVVAMLLSIGASHAVDGNELFARVAGYLAGHWFGALVLVIAIACHRWVLRPPWFPRGVVIAFAFVYACYRPDNGIKRNNLVWFPADQGVWTELAKRKGIVSSFALQGEVGWNTGRKNIPVPEWPMHLYSYRYDHGLDIEDVYIESAASLLAPEDGAFSRMAPGFEGYARLQRYPGHLPGYEVAYHRSSMLGYPRYRVKPHAKASTVYHRTDPAAIEAMRRSPTRLELGDPDTAIYAAHGWGAYVEFDGKHVMVADNRTRARYPAGVERPWEDSSVTFFVDDRRPTSVDFEFYAPHATSYTFYWNLDLWAYDPDAAHADHAVARITVETAGWQHAHIEVPPRLVRRGLNKLGFRVAAFFPVMACPPDASENACLRLAPYVAPDAEFAAPHAVIKLGGITDPEPAWISLLAGALEFHY